MAENDDEQEKGKPRRGAVLCNRRVDGPYVVLPRGIAQGEPPLSPEARTVLLYVTSLPEDWHLRTEQAAKACQMGRDRTLKAMNELEQHKLARFVADRAEDGRIIARWWEFTLTPGQWKPVAEGAGSLTLNFRHRRKSPKPENPTQVNPTQVNQRLQKTDSTQPINKKNQQSDCSNFSSLDLSLSGGATGNGTGPQRLKAPPLRAAGSAMEELPEQWPFPDDADVTRRVRATGMEPQAVWSKLRQQVLAKKVGAIKNLPGYLVGMARKMAKEAYGPADSAALKKARDAMEAKAMDARYARIRVEEDAEARTASPFKPGGFRGELRTYKPIGSGRTYKR